MCLLYRSNRRWIIDLMVIVAITQWCGSYDIIVNVVEAYPNEAGSCTRNKPAVQGSHITNTYYDDDTVVRNRHIQSGSIEKNVDLNLNMNGITLSSLSTTEIRYGVDYFIEIIATKPFKGVLVRLESLTFTKQEQEQGAALYTLTPLTNAQTAMACGASSSVQGVTHLDNAFKYIFSAELLLDLPSDVSKPSYYVMDVTVVDYNNETGSVYWYTQYTFQGVVELSKNENIIPALSPQVASVSPTASPYPTYMSKCYVCGSEDRRVADPSVEVIVLGEEANCGEIENDGRRGFIPPEHCTIVQAAAADACGCQDVPITNAPVVAPTTTHNNSITTQPTRSAHPSISAFPTYTEKCFVCSGKPNQIVLNGLQRVTLEGVIGTCVQLHDDGMKGYIPPELCDDAQRQAELYCNCTDIPSDVFEPTKSPAPSTTPYPSFSEKCHVCNNDEEQHVTAVDQIVNVNGAIGTCLDLEQQGSQGFIHPSLCADAQQIASTICECSNENIPTNVQTLTPTTTPYPTVSFSPTYTDACYICVKPNHIATLPDAIIKINNFALTCNELQQAGLQYSIPPHICPAAQSQALLSCGCSEVASSPSIVPSYNEQCYVCSDDKLVSHPKELILLDDQILNCEELAEAGRWGLIPPQLCDEAMNMASEFCGCIDAVSSPMMDLATLEPTVTPYPTITSSPTYSEKCYICDGYNSSTADDNSNDKNDSPADSTRTIRSSSTETNNRDGVIAYEGYILDCKVLRELGETGSIPPNICPALQEKARTSCACNAHSKREEAPPPKLSEVVSKAATVAQTIVTLGVMVVATLMGSFSLFYIL
jgi:hypothetical protein